MGVACCEPDDTVRSTETHYEAHINSEIHVDKASYGGANVYGY